MLHAAKAEWLRESALPPRDAGETDLVIASSPCGGPQKAGRKTLTYVAVES